MTAGNPERGRLVVIAAPSGAGKTTLVHALLARMPDLRFSISYTTRPKRDKEENGRDYFFVTDEIFHGMVGRHEFLEHANVFDHDYGTGKAHTEALLNAGHSVLLEIDWQGAQQVRASAPDAVSVFVMPPSAKELARRLRARATDSAETIARRLADSLSDMSHWDEFDYVVVNEEVGRATDALAAIVAGGGEENRTDDEGQRQAILEILQK